MSKRTLLLISIFNNSYVRNLNKLKHSDIQLTTPN